MMAGKEAMQETNVKVPLISKIAYGFGDVGCNFSSATDIASLQSAMLDAFVRSVCVYSAMDKENFSAALEKLKSV